MSIQLACSALAMDSQWTPRKKPHYSHEHFIYFWEYPQVENSEAL